MHSVKLQKTEILIIALYVHKYSFNLTSNYMEILMKWHLWRVVPRLEIFALYWGGEFLNKAGMSWGKV